tara:strand:- start:117 stop:257 length:141 start_codon:yes stop_codon:yes gene_type:complete
MSYFATGALFPDAYSPIELKLYHGYKASNPPESRLLIILIMPNPYN